MNCESCGKKAKDCRCCHCKRANRLIDVPPAPKRRVYAGDVPARFCSACGCSLRERQVRCEACGAWNTRPAFAMAQIVDPEYTLPTRENMRVAGVGKILEKRPLMSVLN